MKRYAREVPSSMEYTDESGSKVKVVTQWYPVMQRLYVCVYRDSRMVSQGSSSVVRWKRKCQENVEACDQVGLECKVFGATDYVREDGEWRVLDE